MTNKKKTGLGRGLDSLIPILPDDESDENSLTLEDMLKEEDEQKAIKAQKSRKNSEKTDSKDIKNISNETTNEENLQSETSKDGIEAKSELESSEIIKQDNQSISELVENSGNEDEEISTDSSQSVDTPNKISKPVSKEEKLEDEDKVTQTQSDSPEAEKSLEDIKDNLTEREKQSIDEVIKIIGKNPRITLWSAKSAAVFRYLRKTEPEFSISKEASKLIDEAVKGKYPEIWGLFKNIEK